jgi:hypothetical protein
MNSNIRSQTVRTTAVLAVLMLLSWTAHAREGFYLGAGGATQSASGDLDGTHYFVSSNGSEAILAGKLNSGSGLALLVGYGFSPHVGIEYLAASTSHKATHSLVNLESDASLTAGLFGLRFNFVAAKSFEMFVRAGYGAGTVEYKDYAQQGSLVGNTFVYTSTNKVTFTGAGTGYGLGMEWLGDKIGVSANYTVINVNFDQSSGSSSFGTLPKKLAETITQAALIATYYFK